MELKKMQDLSLEEQEVLIAGTNSSADCNCAECTGCTNEQGSSEEKHMGNWGGVSVANNQ